MCEFSKEPAARRAKRLCEILGNISAYGWLSRRNADATNPEAAPQTTRCSTPAAVRCFECGCNRSQDYARACLPSAHSYCLFNVGQVRQVKARLTEVLSRKQIDLKTTRDSFRQNVFLHVSVEQKTQTASRLEVRLIGLAKSSILVTSTFPTIYATEDKELLSQDAGLATSSSSFGDEGVPPGKHSFPFSLALPRELLPTMEVCTMRSLV